MRAVFQIFLMNFHFVKFYFKEKIVKFRVLKIYVWTMYVMNLHRPVFKQSHMKMNIIVNKFCQSPFQYKRIVSLSFKEMPKNKKLFYIL